MKINTKKLCELYNKEVSSGKNFTMWFDRKNNDLKFNKELQTRVDELNDMEQFKFLSMVFDMFRFISDKKLEQCTSIEGGV